MQERKRLNGRRLQALRKLVLIRDRYACQLQLPGCTQPATQVDHRIPFRDGGVETLENLQASCANCNLRKGAAWLSLGSGGVGNASFRKISPL